MLSSKALAVRVTVAALAALLLALAPATAAEAADEVRLGTDGVSWSSTLSAPLFGTIIGLVPEESRSVDLWVQNASPHSVALRITLETSNWTDEAFADAMTIGASAPGANGATVAATTVSACSVLLSGVTLAPGQSIPVTMTLALGSLTGLIGQDSTVDITIGVTIFETAGAVAPGDCSLPTVVVPITPSAAGASAPLPPAAEIDDAGTIDEQPDPQPSIEPSSPLFILASLARFEDSWLLWALIAVLGGGAIFYLREYSPLRRLLRHDRSTALTDSDERQIP